MSAGQIAVQGRRVGAPIVLALVMSAFALGLVAGVGLWRIVESGSQIARAAGPQIESPLRYGPWSDYVDSTYAAVHAPAK